MPLTLAFIGYGRNANSLHARALESLPGLFKVVAVADPSEASRQTAIDRFGCLAFEQYPDLLRETSPDLVVVMTRSDQHCPMACDVLEAGCSVMVTKPWALNADEARAMMAASRKGGGSILPWLPARWAPDLRRIREIVAEGRLGKVFMVRRHVGSFGLRSDWQTERRFGGGYLLNWGPHLVDQPVQLIGEPVATVYGLLRQVVNPGDVEDFFQVTLTTQSGVILQSEFSLEPERRDNWVIQGSRGTLFIKGRELELHEALLPETINPAEYRQKPDFRISRETLDGDLYGDGAEVYAAAGRALLGEAPFPVSPESALYLTELLDAARASAESQSVVNLLNAGGDPS